MAVLKYVWKNKEKNYLKIKIVNDRFDCENLKNIIMKR